MNYSSRSIAAFIPKEEPCGSILKQAMFFQQNLKTRLFVIDIPKAYSLLPGFLRKKSLKAKHKKDYRELEKFTEDTIGGEIPRDVILRIKHGNIVKTLIKESNKGGHEFILVDKSGDRYRGAFNRNQIDQIVSKSYCPVLSIHKEYPPDKIKKIIIPIDISQTTKKRLYWATLFAKRFNAKVKIVSALNININETKSLAFRNAEKLKALLQDRGVDCEVEILKVHQQAKYEVLLKYIEEDKADLVIIRTHREFQFSGKKIGRFVSEIINGSKVAVFSVGGVPQKHLIKFD